MPQIPLLLCQLLFVGGLAKGSGDTLVDAQSALLTSLLNNYDKRILPQHNASVPVSVSLSIQLINVAELFEHEEILETGIYMQHIWKDFRLTWDPSRYKMVYTIHIPVEQLWQPDIVLFNNADVRLETMNTLAVLFSDGTVFYSPKARIRSRCTMDLTKFPYDEQICQIKLGSFTYDGLVLNLTSFEESNTINLSEYTINKEWDITNTSSTIVSKRYECCPQQFQHLRVDLHLKRNSVYYIHVFVLPAVIVAILVPFQFLLPPDSRERLSIGSVLLLCCTLLIAMVQSFLPEAHPTLPYIVQYYSITLICITVSLMCSIWVINTYNRGPRKRKVPVFVRQVFLKTLRRVLCLSEDTYYPLDESETVSMRSLENKAADPAKHEITNKLEKDVEEILRNVNTLVVRHMVLESRKDVRSEWCQVAVVIDRIMCILFMFIFVIYSCVLLK